MSRGSPRQGAPTPAEVPPSNAVLAAVGLGGNLGDRRAILDAAVRDIAGLASVRVLAVSDWFETEPVGGPPGQGRFLNGAVLARTTLPAREFLRRLQAIEARHGRDRSDGVRNGPRTLDLDLLVHGDERCDDAELSLPHPRLNERAFVLEPLASIAPDLLVPDPSGHGPGRTVRSLLDSLRAGSALLDSLRAASARPAAPRAASAPQAAR